MDKRKKKKLTVIIILSVVVALLLAGVLYYIFKPDNGAKMDTLEVVNGNIEQTLEKTATVHSTEKGEFSLMDGVVVKTVNVKVGETVKKGQVLATFDTSSLQESVDEKLDAYNKAKSAYDAYLSSSSSASGQLAVINSEIAAIESKIAKLEKKIEEQKQQSENDNQAIEDATDEQKSEIEQLKEALNKLIDDTILSSRLVKLILKHSDSAQQVIDALKALINSFGDISGSVDMSGVTSMLPTVSEDQTALIEAQLELAELKVKQAGLLVTSNDSLASIYKKVMDATYDAYTEAKESVDSIQNNWVAKYDGIVSKVDIVAGQEYKSSSSTGNMDISAILGAVTSGDFDISSMLPSSSANSTSVLSIEYFPLTATFMLSKTEVSKVKVGQKVDIILGSDEIVTGTVVYKSAVASSSGSLDLSSVLGGSSAEGLEVKVELDEYNSDIVIGFDVEISIKTEQVDDTVVVPIESIQYENSKAYVYIYNEEENIVKRTEVTIGLRDNRAYEIVSGCEVGDIIIKSPTASLKDGQKVQSNPVGKTAG